MAGDKLLARAFHQLFQPLDASLKPPTIECIVNESPFAGAADQSGVAQNSQVLRNSGLFHSEPSNQGSDTQRTLLAFVGGRTARSSTGEQVQKPHPVWVRKCFEDGDELFCLSSHPGLHHAP
jgi:hypothetical protein